MINRFRLDFMAIVKTKPPANRGFNSGPAYFLLIGQDNFFLIFFDLYFEGFHSFIGCGLK